MYEFVFYSLSFRSVVLFCYHIYMRMHMTPISSYVCPIVIHLRNFDVLCQSKFNCCVCFLPKININIYNHSQKQAHTATEIRFKQYIHITKETQYNLNLARNTTHMHTDKEMSRKWNKTILQKYHLQKKSSVQKLLITHHIIKRPFIPTDMHKICVELECDINMYTSVWQHM